MFEELIKAASERKDALKMFKNLAVKCQQFELAVKLREIEKEKFPISQEEKDITPLSDFLKSLDINIEPRDVYFLKETFKLYDNNLHIPENMEALARKIKDKF